MICFIDEHIFSFNCVLFEMFTSIFQSFCCYLCRQRKFNRVDTENTNNAVFKSPDCPSTSSFRHWKKSQITYADKRRAQQSVEAQIAWAEQAKRKDKDDAEWDDAAAQTANPGLDEFELVLEKMERSKTADGRCEKALQRLLHHRGTWAGSTSYRGQSWLWYVQKLLPRYYGHAKAWSTIAMHRRSAQSV